MTSYICIGFEGLRFDAGVQARVHIMCSACCSACTHNRRTLHWIAAAHSICMHYTKTYHVTVFLYILHHHHHEQLYVDGEFMGGSDIMIELYQSGELETTMKDKGVKFNA
jgi:hypothetical protein